MAKVRQLVIDQGADYNLLFHYPRRTDISNLTIRFQARETYDGPVLLQGSTADLITTSGNIATLHIPPALTSSLKFDKDSPDLLELVYDFEFEEAGRVVRMIQGSMLVNREVTR